MTLEFALQIIAILVFLFVIAHGRAEYWRGRSKALEESNNQTNDSIDLLSEENRFWRFRDNLTAATKAQE